MSSHQQRPRDPGPMDPRTREAELDERERSVAAREREVARREWQWRRYGLAYGYADWVGFWWALTLIVIAIAIVWWWRH